MSTPFLLHDNRFDDGIPTATSEAADYPVENAFDLRPYKFWKATTTDTQYLTIDCASALSADTLGIMGHNLGTVGATVSVEYSTTGVWGGEEVEALAGFVPSDDTALLKIFTTAEKRYWRVKITGASAVPYIAVLMLGERLTFPSSPTIGFDPMPETIVAETVNTLEGHPLGAVIKYKPIKIAPFWPYLQRSWVLDTFKTIYDSYLSLLKPFFWTFDLEDNYQGEALFMQLEKGNVFRAPNDGMGRVTEFTLRMKGIRE